MEVSAAAGPDAAPEGGGVLLPARVTCEHDNYT